MSESKKIKCVVQRGKFQVKKGVFAKPGDTVELTESQVVKYADCILPLDTVKNASIVQPKEEVKEPEAKTEGTEGTENKEPEGTEGKQGGLFGRSK